MPGALVSFFLDDTVTGGQKCKQRKTFSLTGDCVEPNPISLEETAPERVKSEQLTSLAATSLRSNLEFTRSR